MTLTGSDAVLLGAFLECTFYGVYIVLFTLYLVLQHRNNRSFGPLTLAQILLFGLCTLSFCLDIPMAYFSLVSQPTLVHPRQYYTQTTEDDATISKLGLGSTVLFGIIDCLAQMILLYRCWVIWDGRWVVIAIPGFLALVALVGQFALVVLSVSNANNSVYILTGTAANSISLVVNALATSLIVTKILITSREVGSVLGFKSQRSFRIAAALLIESGLLMFSFQLVYVVIYFQIPFYILSGATTQIYGITPTLVNIQVAMGSAYDKSTEKTRTLRFAHSGGTATQTTGPSMSVAGIQSQVINTELDDVSNNERAADNIV